MSFLDWLDKIMPEKIEDVLPKYTEITLFLTSLTAFLIFSVSPEFRGILLDFFIYRGDPKAWFVFIIILIGFASSIYYSFTDIKISKFNRYSMFLFVLMINVLIGLSAGSYLLKNSLGVDGMYYFVEWLFGNRTELHLPRGSNVLDVIFPIINIINAVILLILWRFKILDETAVLDAQAKRSEILVGSFAVIIIFAYSHYISQDYWAITFSMCLVYATILNEIINKILFPNKTVIIK
jgi:hypothetical protein